MLQNPERRFYETLDIIYITTLFPGGKSYGMTFHPDAPCPADTVNIILWILRYIVIYHKLYPFHINAT